MKRLVIYGLILTMIALCLAGCGRKGLDFSFVSDDTVWGNGQEASGTSTPKPTRKAKKEKNTAVSQAPEAKEDETVRRNDHVTIVEGP
jgi:predicted small lipoprotein YifL